MNNIFKKDLSEDLAYHIFNQDSSILNSPEDLAEVIEKYLKEINLKDQENVIFERIYSGFEDASDLERDVSEALEEIPSEFEESIKVTIKYVEDDI